MHACQRVGIALLALFGIGAAACGSDSKDEPSASSASASASSAPTASSGSAATPTGESTIPAGEYTIGFGAMRSGPVAFAGQPMVEGAEIAVEELNEKQTLGDGVKLKLDVQDNASEVARAIPIMEKFARSGVTGVLCCTTSAEGGSLKPVIIKSKVPAIAISTTAPDFAEPPYVYRTVLLLQTTFDGIVEDLVKTGDFKTAVVGVTADSEGVATQAKFWVEALKKHGVEVQTSIDTLIADTDFSGPATQVLDRKPDIFVASMYGPAAAGMIKELRDRGYEGTILAGDGIATEASFKVGGAALEGVIFPVSFTPLAGTKNAMVAELNDRYEKKYGAQPSFFAAQGYVGVMMLAQAMLDAGSGKAEDVAKSLAEIKSMDTIYGTIRFEGGQAILETDPYVLTWNADGSQSLWAP